MTRLIELNDLHDQAVRHALIAERTGFPGTAKALMALARDLDRERMDLLAPPSDGRHNALRGPRPNWMSMVAAG